jgi:hypothetical protein
LALRLSRTSCLLEASGLPCADRLAMLLWVCRSAGAAHGCRTHRQRVSNGNPGRCLQDGDSPAGTLHTHVGDAQQAFSYRGHLPSARDTAAQHHH